MASNNDPLQGLTIDQIDVTDPETRKFMFSHVDLTDPETKRYFDSNPVKGVESVLGASIKQQTPSVPVPYGNIDSDERVVFSGDMVAPNEVEVQARVTPEQQSAITAAFEARRGDPSFSDSDVQSIYQSVGLTAGAAADPKFVEAIRNNRQYTSQLPVGQIEAEQKAARDAAVSAEAQRMAEEREGQGLFSRELEEGSLYGFPGLISRLYYDATDYGIEELRKMYPGETDEWYEDTADKTIGNTVRALRESFTLQSDKDPAWRPDKNTLTNLASVHRWVPAVLGAAVTSVGPESAVAPGATAGARMFAQSLVSGGSEAVYEALDNAQDLNDGVSFEAIAAATALGGLFQGGMEGAGKLIRGRKSNADKSVTEVEPEVATRQRTEVTPTDTPMPTRQDEMDFEFNPRQMEMDPQPPVTRQNRLAEDLRRMDELKRQRNTPERTQDVEWRDQELPLGGEEHQLRLFDDLPIQRQETELDLEASPRRAPVDTIIEVTPRMKSVMDYSDKLTGNWKNGPEVHVYDTFEGLNDIDPYALGAYTPEGQVILNSSLIEAEAKARGISPQQMTNTVLFHEGLGHFGLAQKFREDLDGMLGKWVDNSPQFRQAVQTWKTKNAGEYGDDTDIDLDIRAAEEVLAEMSEKGVLPKSLLNQAMNFIKATARKMGLKLNYSMREIKTILSQSHDAVVNGRGADVRGNGFTPRYMKSSFGKGSEGPLRGKAAADDKANYDRSNVLNAYRTKDDVQDILDEVTPEKTRESFDQWIDEAGTTKNSRKIAEGLSTGTTPAELLVAEDYLLRTVNKAKELSRMATEGRATERDTYLLGEALERASVVAGKIQEVVANAARILNVRKIEIATDKQLSKTLRQMLSSLTPDQMNNPQKILKVAERLDKGDEKAKAIAGLLKAKTELLSLPRSIMSSLDLSAPFRQGVFLVGRQDFWKNIIPMFKMFGDEANYKSMMDSIKDRPNYRLMEQSRLGITDLGGNLHAREEDFISSWAEKIPVIGRGVRASGRAYTGFLNKLRADTFDSLLGNYRDMGIEPTPEQLRGIAKYVNNATGRGDLKSFEQAAPDLAAVFFSPRLIASRINLLNPVQYAKMDPILRREAVKDLLKFGTIAGTVLGLASASGARVETDPRSSDFAKIRVGDTRYDILGGFGQYLTLGSRLMTLEKKNAAGEVKSLRRQPGEERRPGEDNPLDVVTDFFANKFSPLASLARDYMVGENPVGDPFEPTDAVVSRMVPLFFQDAYELIKAEGAVGVPMIAPALFGIGVQNYAVDLGYDVLGRDIEELQISGEDNDPISVQIRSLKEETGKDVFGPSRPPKFDGVPIEKNEWSQVIGHYTNEFLKEDTNLPEFVNGTPEEKVAIMKAARKDAYQEAKTYFQQQLEEQGVTIDETGNE